MIRMLVGDCRDILQTLASDSVHCVVTSPPYFGLRDYGIDGQIGLEKTPAEYVAELVSVFREVRRALRPDGTLWLNLGDSYVGGGGFSPNAPSNLAGAKQTTQGGAKPGGIKPTGNLKGKDLIGIPWMAAFALRDDGWWLRQDIIWSKPNPMPESVTDRCTKAHEYMFLLSKSERYWFDAEAIREAGAEPDRQRNDRIGGANGHTVRHSLGALIGASATRNKRSVWTVATQALAEAHFATFPPALIEPCILAGCPPGGTVLDPFAGAGTTGLVADRLQRNAVLIELNPAYCSMTRTRITDDAPLFAAIREEISP